MTVDGFCVQKSYAATIDYARNFIITIGHRLALVIASAVGSITGGYLY